MNTTELIVEHLQALGFSPKDIDGEGTDFKFDYRGKTYLLMDNDGDENFVRFAIPRVFSVTDENKPILLNQIQQLGFNIKYIKAAICTDSVWIFYEHYQEDGTAITEATVEHIIRTMAAALKWFYAELENYDEEV
ncbi:MAG: hypothetical protein IJV06_08905 [Bacteroidaceae bacterium]|nr:hypothetical protein [Bacteroidaceae bacterium]